MENFKNQESLKPYFEKSYGWTVFPTLGKIAIFFVGVAGGRGDVYLKEGEKKVGEATCIQVNAGFQLGGQVYSEIIFFETEKDFTNFTNGNLEFGADANACALTASAGVKATTMGKQGLTAGITARDTTIGEHECIYVKGMKVYTLTLGGLMYQAAVSGQKFLYKPLES